MSEPAFRVLFASSISALEDQNPPFVGVIPDSGDWNDFSARTGVRFYFVAGPSQRFKVEGRLAVQSAEPGARSRYEDARRVVELVRTEGVFDAVERQLTFYTMLHDLDAYRTVVGELGPDEAKKVLLTLRDVVATKEYAPGTKWLAEATQSSVFALSFLRNSESFFAFHNAGPILRGLRFEELGKLSDALGITFKLDGFENEHRLTFRFEHRSVLPKRIAVVIGKNGVGKSQTLGQIARSAVRGRTNLVDGLGNRPMISRLIAISPSQEAASVFPSNTVSKGKIWYRRLVINQRQKGSMGTPSLILQTARSGERIRNLPRWRIFLTSLQSLQSPEQICLQTRDQTKFEPLRNLADGNEKAVLERFGRIEERRPVIRLINGTRRPLSSGENAFIRFAAQASLLVENGTLLLIDEPETHLHPNLITRFVDLLNRILEATGSAAVVATHSPFFVKEVFREQVTVLRASNGHIESLVPRLRTFGGDLGSITSFVFGDEGPSVLAREVKRKLIDEGLSWDALFEKYKDELSPELLTSLRNEGFQDEGA